MRIISVQVPPALLGPCYELVEGMTHLDRALIAVLMCNGFHSGYSTAIADLSGEKPRNLHMEYVNEQNSATPPAAGKPAASAGSNN